MIPSKLKLNNFMSYKGKTDVLDFDDWSVACITGDNGNGKSALLEAITWSLWGKTRVQSSRDLISKGENEMFAELEFDIDFISSESLSNTKYRILRSIKSKGSQKLNFEQFNGTEFTSISGNTVSETQRTIEKIVNMNYETFVNTSYLMQGNADRFSTSQPTKRKEILSEILNLNEWQKLSDFSKKKLTDIKNQIGFNSMLNERISNELLQLDPEQIGLNEHKKELKEIECKLSNKEKTKKDNESKILEFNNLSNAVKIDTDKKNILQENLKSKNTDIQLVTDEIISDKKLLVDSKKINLDYEKILSQYIEFNELGKSFSKYQEFNSKIDKLQIVLTSIIKNNDLELNNIAANIVELKKKLESEKSTFTNNKNAITKLQNDQKDLSCNSKELDLKIVKYDSNIENLNKEILKKENIIEDFLQKIDLLKFDDNICPVCKSKIDDNSKNRLIENYNNEIEQYNSLFIKDKNNLSDQMKTRDQIRKDYKTVNDQFVNNDNQIKYLASENNKIKIVGDNYNNEIIEKEKNKNKLLNYKENNFEYKDLNEQLFNLKKEIDELNFDQDRYNYLLENVQTQKIELEKEKFYIDQAVSRTTQNNQKLKLLNEDKKTIENDIKILEENIVLNKGKLDVYDFDIEIIHDLESEIKELTNDKHSKSNFIDNLQSKLDLVEDTKIKNKKLFEKQNNLEILVKSFGTNGIPSQIIEYSLPELSRETNKLLSALTENNLTVEFRKIDGKKISGSESFSQEIEIFIADHNGVVRDYETYSGGESFRIDFAIRIALSRLISLRSGVRSPILFIDEGFGSQDQEGQDRLREAIQTVSISNDYKFKKIIIITHLESLKESFDRAIEVEKNGGISSFSLN